MEQEETVGPVTGPLDRGRETRSGQPLAPAGVRVGVIDIGTNSVKFHLGERDETGHWCSVVDRALVTGLGEGLRETGEIGPGAWARTLAAICRMAEEARAQGAGAVLALGTMGLRTARNSAAFIAAVAAQCGVRIEVIDGETEARLAYLAVQAGTGLPAGAVTVFDSGGGSTQVTIGRGGRVLERLSLDVGAVRYTEQFGLARPVDRGALEAAQTAIGRDLGRLDAFPAPDRLIGMGGGVTNLAAVGLGLPAYAPDRVQGSTLTRAEIARQIDLYAALDSAGRRAVPGLQPGRADVILAGALIVLSLLDRFRRDTLVVSDRGLRHGVLIERFPGA